MMFVGIDYDDILSSVRSSLEMVVVGEWSNPPLRSRADGI